MDLDAKVDAIPGPDGWWTESARRTYREAAGELLDLGVKEDEAVEFLQELWDAAAECFGG